MQALKGLTTPFGASALALGSVLVVGLMWVLPFLHYLHQYPLTTFYQEWWSVLLGMLALVPLVARSYWQDPQIPRIVQLPVALIALVLLQWGLGMIVYFDQAMLYALYLLFAVLLMMLGARLRECLGMPQLARVLAIFLLVGAELSALIGVLQHYRWQTPLNPVIVMKVAAGVFGNLAQPNHFANYIALGLASLGLLQLRLRVVYAVLLAAPLLFVMTLSGSRSAWLYLFLMAALAWWCARRLPLMQAEEGAVESLVRANGLRVLLRYCLWLIAGYAGMHLLVQLPFFAGADQNYDTVQRLFDDASGGIRLYLWREAALMFSASPWLGVGFGQFAWQHFQLLPQMQQGNILGLYNNAHNLVFHLAAEAGLAGLLVLFASLGVWLYGLRRSVAGAEQWWAQVALGVLGIHSLLEYPLWYSYFVAIAAFLLGALDETRYRLELRAVGRLSVMAIVLLGLATLVQLRIGYHQLEGVLAIRPQAGERSSLERMRDGLVAVHGKTLLSPYAELFMSSLIEINAEHLEAKLELNGRVMRFAPIGTVVYRQTLLLAQDGKQDKALALLVQARASYPEELSGLRRQLTELAEKDPAHFSALLEFALKKN